MSSGLKSTREFDKELEELLRRVADLEQSEAKRREAEEELKRFYDIQNVINSLLRLSLEQRSVEDLLNIAMDLILSIPWLAFESKGAIFLVEDESDVLVLQAEKGMPEQLKKMCDRVLFGRCLCGRAALKQRIEFAESMDERHDNRYPGMEDHGHYCIPIIYANKTIGVLGLYTKTGHPYSKKEEEILSAIANTLAGVFERQRSEEAIREKEGHVAAMINAFAGIMYTCSQDYRIEFMNQKLIERTGYDGTGGICYEVMHDRDSVCPWCVNDRVFKGETVQWEVKSPKDDRWFYVVNSPLYHADGTISKVSMSFDITEQHEAQEKLEESFEKLHDVIEGTIEALSHAAEMRDPYTAGHQIKAANLACAIAKDLDLPGESLEALRIAGTLHDIGKMHIPAQILNKPGQLTETERELIKAHVEDGYEILKSIPFETPISNIILQHHERIDGSGYPRGLKGDAIIKEARILGVADVVEAMASHRPYRPAYSIEQALEEISKGKEKTFDAEVVDSCIKLFTKEGFDLQRKERRRYRS
jgi:putative nucleotidyltransferase with HDIG domain